jgi:release factor glutamine methyltransferase
LTLHDTLAQARARLVASGIPPDEAAIDVDLYVRTILGWDRARVITEQQAPAPAALEPRFSEWIERRERREPTAYIVGTREFWGLEFVVTPSVLIPRPESEFIVQEAVERLREVGSPRIVDVGTGSGCIAISIAHELPQARITATDISGKALEVARENAARHGVADRISFVETSYLDAVDGTFDAVVSNPPYVKDEHRALVERAVVKYEPHVALFGGPDGLTGLRSVLAGAGRRLGPGGWIIFEFGDGQEDDVRELVGRYPGYRLLDIKDDLQGIPRTAVVKLESAA